MPDPTPKKRRGGRPIYTPEAATARAEGKVTLRLSPEDAAALRRRGAEHPGGMTGLVAGWLRLVDPGEDAAIHEGLVDLLREGPVLLALDRGDVILRLLREPVGPSTIVAEGGGPGIHEALLGLRRR